MARDTHRITCRSVDGRVFVVNAETRVNAGVSLRGCIRRAKTPIRIIDVNSDRSIARIDLQGAGQIVDAGDVTAAAVKGFFRNVSQPGNVRAIDNITHHSHLKAGIRSYGTSDKLRPGHRIGRHLDYQITWNSDVDIVDSGVATATVVIKSRALDKPGVVKLVDGSWGGRNRCAGRDR
jgi:hypothetical protein